MYVEIPGHGRNKLNAAYAFGGEALLYQTLAQNFNIKIDKFCVVDLAAFEKVINRIGGIEMTLEQREAEYLNTTNYISKKKIEDTIEELKGKLEDISKRREKSKTKEEETVLWCLEIRTDERIKTLQELL